MIVRKTISQAVSAGCFAGLTAWSCIASADTGTLGLLNPLLAPQQQGWTLDPSAPEAPNIGNNGYAATFSTIAEAGTGSLLFYRQVPVLVQDSYAVDFWLKVNEQQTPHDQYGGGLVLHAGAPYPQNTVIIPGSPYSELAVAQLVYFDEDGIGWGDESATFAIDTTDDFHHYRVEVSASTARVLVDGELALEREDFKASPYIAFGDGNQQSGFNSNFSVLNLTVSGLLTTPVSVDIRPTACPNGFLARRSAKSVPVSISGTADFDVSRIDPATVRINGVAPKGWAIRDASKPLQPYLGKTSINQCARGTDGRPDLVVAFEERALAATLTPLVENQPTAVRVTGKLKPEFGGQAFAGDDVLRVKF